MGMKYLSFYCFLIFQNYEETISFSWIHAYFTYKYQKDCILSHIFKDLQRAKPIEIKNKGTSA